jgi:hypothetical protein
MEGARDRFETFDYSRARAGDEGHGHDRESLPADRLEAPRGYVAPECGESHAAVGGGEIDVGVESRQIGERKGPRPGAWPSDALPPCLGDEVAEERAVGDGGSP